MVVDLNSKKRSEKIKKLITKYLGDDAELVKVESLSVEELMKR